MIRDLRLAFRLFTLRPGFCAAIVLTLAIGLGAATAIFALAYALLLRPLPFADPQRLVVIDAIVADDAGRLTLNEYRDLERDSRTMEGFAAYYRTQYTVTAGGRPEAISSVIASSTLFTLLGVPPLHGDIWSRADDFTRQFTVVLSHRLWQQRFGGRPDVAGSTMTMDGVPYRVLGVMPEGFDFPVRTDVFRAVTDYNAPHVRRYSVLARLRPDRSLHDAQAELDAFAARFASTYPEANRGVTLRALSLRDAYVGRARPFVLLLLGAVVLLLLIAAANVGNLLLSRAVGRRGDVALRLALGASRARIVWPALLEALLLATAGALVGGVAARAALHLLTGMVAAELPPWLDVRLDGAVLLFTAAVTLLTAAAIGAAPALHAARTDAERALRQGSARAAGSGRQSRARRWLVAGQAMVATLLLVAAALFVSGLRDLLRQDTGFRADSVLTFRVDPPFSRYTDVATTSALYRLIIERLSQLPGVTAVGTNNQLPFSSLDLASPRIGIEGRSQGRGDEEPFVNFQIVDPDYFKAMQIRLRAGRVFDWRDAAGAPGVAVISERAARRFWGTADPLGKRLRVAWNNHGTTSAGGADVWLTVVGVVANVRFSGLQDDAGLELYATHDQLYAGDTYVVLRAAGDVDTLRQQLAPAVQAIDPDQPIFDLRVMQARVDASIWQPRVASLVLALFAIVSLGLAVVGTYAVTAHAVAAQRRDIGIRLALGSSPAQVLALVMRQWVTPVLAGTLAGAALGLLLARLLTSAIGLTTSGTLTAALLPALLVAAAAVACAAPVRRVTRQIQLVDELRAG